MRALRTVARKFIFPVACFACVAWAAGFAIGFAHLRHHDLGKLVLFGFGGLVLLLPWLVIAVSLFERMRERAAHEAPRLDDGA